MKKTVYTLIALFITIGSFAQKQEGFQESLQKLMEARNGSSIFTKIIDTNIQNIDKDKQAAFKIKVAESASKRTAEAVKFFTKKYTKTQIDRFYKEFTEEGRIDYSDGTMSFIRHWRTYKNLFQKDFKEIYYKFQE